MSEQKRTALALILLALSGLICACTAWAVFLNQDPVAHWIGVLMKREFDETEFLIALEHLEKLGPEAEIALVEELRHHNLERKRVAATALAALARNPRISAPALVHPLSDEDPAVRAAAAQTLGRFSENADRETRQALARARDDDHPWVRQAAEASLRAIHGKAPHDP